MNRNYLHIAKQTSLTVFAALCATILTGCGVVFDDLDPCPSGVEMRFVYDYNTEDANAFSKQVDCLTLYVYDEQGNLLSSVTPPAANLANEDWRLHLDLAPGSYHAIAYGGISCDKASFSHVPTEPIPGDPYQGISMQLKDSHIGTHLHDHFHGAIDFAISENADGLTTVTMPMTKTTNHFRILLRQLDGQPLDGNDFEFYITDDNKELDHTNTPVKSGHDIIYPANLKGQVEEVAFAELSTSRLHLSNSPRFIITSKDGGETKSAGEFDPDKVIVDLPLNPYLIMAKPESTTWGNQEYLDRCSQWNMTFFLDENRQWSQTRIIINGWTVRINDL